MPSCLMVRPAPSAEPNGGDTVVYRELAAYLANRAQLDTLELERLPKPRHVLNLLRGLPPEVGGYAGGANRTRLAQALAARPYDVVIFAHESTFPLSDLCKPGLGRRVLFSHNVQSIIAASDSRLLAPLMRPMAAAFDRRWCSDPEAQIICISRADAEGLGKVGVNRNDIAVAPPGAPASGELRSGAVVTPELVLAGSYGWWRKRRDLMAFAEERPELPYPILTSDPAALVVLKDQAAAVTMQAVDWGAGLRFGLVTDRFLGGFKLKSLEYVALNAAVLSWCDLSPEFEGLPHAAEFVRCVSSKAEVAATVAEFMQAPAADVLARFQKFKTACLQRFAWEQCLEPFGRALQVAGAEAGRPRAT